MSQATIAVLGNPNCGKTTLFNRLTGARQQVGNWPGVTVEKKSGSYIWEHRAITLIDLPGTYSLDVGIGGNTAIDEKVARDFILANEADLYINIIDAGNIERNLYLTTQMLEMNRPMIVVLNMMDAAKEKGISIDTAELSKRLGCQVVPVVASRNDGTDALKKVIENHLSGIQNPHPVKVTYSEPVEEALASIAEITADQAQELGVNTRWLAGRLLEGDQTLESLFSIGQMAAVIRIRAVLQADGGEDVDILFADNRYQFIETLIDGVVRRSGKVSQTMTHKIDAIVLNRVLGLPIFFAIMYLMFMFTINVGGALIDFFDIAAGTVFVDGTRYLLEGIGSPAFLTALLANGVGGGLQTVTTFIPVIGCLFLFLSVLEDSGYMARAAFVMDRAMRALGLPGKAFVPVLIGFGCNVPAIMATRTLEQERDRKLTILMNPFMSCGARLPVYALFAVVFFPESGQNVVFFLYLIGILVAVVTGLIMKHTLLPGEMSPFVMELPSYHLPTLQSMALRTWDRLKSFIIKAGQTIVIMVTVLSVLNSLGTDGTLGNENTEKSALSAVGRTLTPLFSPMGMQEDNWPAAVGIFTGVFAKEAVVGTLDALYNSLDSAEADDADEYNLLAGLSQAWATIPANFAGLIDTVADPLGLNVGTTNDATVAAEEQGVHQTTYEAMRTRFGSQEAAFAYLLFILLYVPCVAAMGAVKREAGSRWMWLVGAWSTYMAYLVAGSYYQLVTFFAHPMQSVGWLSLLLASFIGILVMLHYNGRQIATMTIPITVRRSV